MGRLLDNLRLFADIVRFRKGPEDLPVSVPLLVYCVFIGIVVRALLLSVLPMPFVGNPLVILLIDAGATLLFVALVLGLAKRPERFLQTASAVFGYQLVMLPVLVCGGSLYTSLQADPFWRLPVLMLNVAVEIWALAVLARILHSASGWPVFACVALSIAGDLLTFMALVSLFPLTPAAPVQP